MNDYRHNNLGIIDISSKEDAAHWFSKGINYLNSHQLAYFRFAKRPDNREFIIVSDSRVYRFQRTQQGLLYSATFKSKYGIFQLILFFSMDCWTKIKAFEKNIQVLKTRNFDDPRAFYQGLLSFCSTQQVLYLIFDFRRGWNAKYYKIFLDLFASQKEVCCLLTKPTKEERMQLEKQNFSPFRFFLWRYKKIFLSPFLYCCF
jgi:hypothetical protein